MDDDLEVVHHAPDLVQGAGQGHVDQSVAGEDRHGACLHGVTSRGDGVCDPTRDNLWWDCSPDSFALKGDLQSVLLVVKWSPESDFKDIFGLICRDVGRGLEIDGNFEGFGIFEAHCVGIVELFGV